MTKRNVIDWVMVEELAGTYAKATDEFVKEDIIAKVFDKVENYIRTSVRNATNHALDTGLSIPAEDFESYMLQAVWKAVESFEEGGNYAFKSIMARRIQFAEADVFRLYRRKSDDANDKDGYTYQSARWESINRQVGGDEGTKELGELLVSDAPTTEEIVTDNDTIEGILSGFETLSKAHKRHATIIRHLYLGFESDDLAIATGLGDSYNGNVRKYVSRAKDAFSKYMSEKATV